MLLIEKDFRDLGSLTGREIIGKKYSRLRNQGERYGEVLNTALFGLSVAATHLDFVDSRE